MMGQSSYAVRPDMKILTGIFMSIGEGGKYKSSCKQKLNAKCSTEAAIVEKDNGIDLILWTRHFLATQGYTYQLQQSTRITVV